MRKTVTGLLLVWMLLLSLSSAEARVSIGISTPNVSIGINMPAYPEFVPVPGYPVYYAPRVAANYFFYDGMYWVYWDDNWYASSWYNGPWGIVDPWYVPPYILRIPVRYYRQPPPYFRGWQRNAPPRWGQYWGHEWEHDRRGWDKWKRGSAPAPAPLPAYQRQYNGDRYPRRIEEQNSLRNENYRYQPRNRVVREHYQQVGGGKWGPSDRRREQAGPRPEQPVQGREQYQRPAPAYPSPQQRPPAVREQYPRPEPAYQERRGPGSQGQEQRPQYRDPPPENNRGHEKGPKGEGRGRGRDD